MRPRPPGNITEPLDPPIVPLVEALRADNRVVTMGSCWGHGKTAAYVDLAVEGMDGLRCFVERVNHVDRAVKTEAFLDIGLNWSEEVATSCAFDLFPDWIMLSWTVRGRGRGRSPSADLLSKIARRYRASRSSSNGRG